MPKILSGKTENIPYSLSRWTDISAAKWTWFKERLKRGWMEAVDQRTSVPARWSLKPEDTLGLILWTRDPRNLLSEVDLLRDYRVKVHVTVTGWSEVEKGAPTLYEGGKLLCDTAKAFGPENVTWRFSPVPILSDVRERFRAIASMAADANVPKVFIAFLQDNDYMIDERSKTVRRSLLHSFADDADLYGIRVRLCYDDRELLPMRLHTNLSLGVCAPPEDFTIPGVSSTATDTCGCAVAVDPFSINESCTMGCKFCYAADRSTAPKKRNTTKSLPVVR